MPRTSHDVDASGYPVDPVLKRLEFSLGDLASEWRESSSDPKRQHSIMRLYQQTLLTLYELGWDAELDLESHLPDDLMPEEYRLRVKLPHKWGSQDLSDDKPKTLSLE